MVPSGLYGNIIFSTIRYQRRQEGTIYMIRQKIIHCDKYGIKSKFIEVDLYPVFEVKRTPGERNRKNNESCPEQKNLNSKRAKRYFNQLAKTNFTNKDYHLSLTYNDGTHPESIEDAERESINYIRRVNRRRKAKGLNNAKYMIVTECSNNGRIHHHLIIEGGLSREEMEALWSRKRINWKKFESDSEYRENIEFIGYANATKLQFDEKGIEALCNYLCKDPKGRRRWRQSKNLIKPWYMNPVDGKYSRRKIEKMANLPQDCEEVKTYWERQYKGYILDESVAEFNEITGRWSIYLKMHLRR